MMMKKWIVPLALLFTACNNTEHTPASTPARHDSTSVPSTTSEEKMEPVHTSVLDETGTLPANLQSFVPAGFAALDTASGDLNMDGKTDMILVLKSLAEDTLSDIGGDEQQELRRPMLLLLGQDNGAYTLAARNDNAVLCHNCGGIFGDPFTGITIKNGYFSIEHGIAGGQHWESATTFKYDTGQAKWFEHRDGYISYRMNDKAGPEEDALVKDMETQKTVKDFGIVPFEQYDAYKE